jgi:cell division protein FtsI (penicillin-binding protein 3)
VEIETANAAFGQGISVTTVQLAMAFAAIANGGKLLEPLLVQKVTDGRGRIVREGTTRVRREAVPAHVARVVADMLTAVTEDGGTGLEAAVPGFRVAGKTATAQKVDPNTGRYAADRFTSSFVGFVPADRPRLVIAVVLDDPTIGHYGGDLAGPVFRRVAESSLRYLGVGGSQSHGKLAQVRRDGDVADTTIASMKPLPTSEGAAESSSSSPLAASGFVAQSSFVGPAGQRVPDVAGLGMRDAVRVITTSGFSPQLEGWGRLVRQMPAPGTSLAKGATVRLIFELGT